jgi:hypothetical protein
MDVSEILLETYGRVPPLVRDAVEGLTEAQLAQRPGPDANTVGWLPWHLTRVQDHHVAELLEQEQVWTTSDWAGRFGITADAEDHGYSHDPQQVAAVRPDSPDAVIGYHEAVWSRTRAYLGTLGPADLDRVVDERWDPPVTLGVRLVSVVDDALQHVGQAAFVRGLLGA